MRVAVVSPVFPPEPVVSSRTTSDVAEALAARGHMVRVITGYPNRPSGRIYPGYSRWLYRAETLASGVEVLRCFASCSRRSTLTSRFLENISFGVTSSLALLFGPKPDVIYSVAWPIFASAFLQLVATLRGIPVVTSIQDLYPESMIAQGRIRSDGVFARLLRAVDHTLAMHSRALIVISESFRDVYVHNRGVPVERVCVVPNWMDRQSVSLDSEAGRAFRARLGLPESALLAVYAGNVGAAAGVETLIEGFRELQSPSFHLLIAGEGSRLEACKRLANGRDGERILFHHPWPTEETSAVLNAADVLLLPTRGMQSLASVPSKLIAYMLASKPVLVTAVAGSELAAMVERTACGVVVAPDSPAEIAAGLGRLAAMAPAERADAGRRGREFAESNLVSDVCVPHLVDVIIEAAK